MGCKSWWVCSERRCYELCQICFSRCERFPTKKSPASQDFGALLIYSMVPETFLTFPRLTMDRQITDGFFLLKKLLDFPLPVDIHMDSAYKGTTEMWRSLHAWISLEWGFLWHSRRKGIMEDASVFPNLSHSGVFWRCFVVGDVNVSLSSKGLRVNCWKSYQSVTKSWDKITRYGKRMLEWWMLWIGIKPFSKLRRQWWDSPDIYNL